MLTSPKPKGKEEKKLLLEPNPLHTRACLYHEQEQGKVFEESTNDVSFIYVCIYHALLFSLPHILRAYLANLAINSSAERRYLDFLPFSISRLFSPSVSTGSHPSSFTSLTNFWVETEGEKVLKMLKGRKKSNPSSVEELIAMLSM